MVSTRQVPFVDLKAQYDALASDIDARIKEVIRSTSFISGPDVAAFEAEFAEYCGVGHAIGVDNGTSALELALRAVGIGAGDEVITAGNTFFATAVAISFVGAKPVFADVDPQTYTLSPEAVERALAPATRAIIPVHLCGQMADMDPIMEVAHAKGLFVIEDACQAHGARYKGRRAGSIGHLACFSFYPSKNLGAYGDGGMVVTDDGALAERLRLFREYGQRKKHEHLLVGHNRRLDTLQAAVLRAKLPHLDEWNAARRRHAQRYNALLAGSAVTVPYTADHNEHVFHLYAVQADKRDELRSWLAEWGVQTGIHYPIPIHLQPAYAHLGYKRGDLPVCEGYAARTLSLPMYAELTDEHTEYVAQVIHSFPG